MCPKILHPVTFPHKKSSPAPPPTPHTYILASIPGPIPYSSGFCLLYYNLVRCIEVLYSTVLFIIHYCLLTYLAALSLLFSIGFFASQKPSIMAGVRRAIKMFQLASTYTNIGNSKPNALSCLD